MFFRLCAAFMLCLRRRGLVAFRDVQSCFVELRFEVAVMIEPDDGVGDGEGAGRA